jgi:aryl-alcohol dehydrogenase-like predicted oxidoreductase
VEVHRETKGEVTERHRGVSLCPIRATRPEQVAAYVAALDWSPGEADLEELDRIAPTPRAAAWTGRLSGA